MKDVLALLRGEYPWILKIEVVTISYIPDSDAKQTGKTLSRDCGSLSSAITLQNVSP